VREAPNTALPLALAKEASGSEKERRRQLGESRTLDAWERYRALNDAMDEAYELTGIATREARFALVMMGGLNAGMFIAATRPELMALLAPAWRVVAAGLLGSYGLVALYCVLQAIEALRPRKFRSELHGVAFDAARLRYFGDVIEREPDAHWRAWQDVKLGELNADLTAQTHSVARRNASKHEALRRLYVAMKVMVSLTAAFMTLVAFHAVLR
jgi:hypothetical protein